MFLIEKRKSANVLCLTLCLEVTVRNPIMSSWTVTFSVYESACLELFQTVTSETILRKKSYSPVFINIKLVLLLAACANTLVGSFPYKYMSYL